MLRRRQDPLAHVVPADAPARWRSAVEVALEHRRRFVELRDLIPPGPVKDRVEGLAGRVDAGVLAVWDLVQRGAVAQRVLETIDPDDATAQLKDARRRLAAAEQRGEDTVEAGRQVESQAARHRAAQRVWNEVDDLGSRLEAIEVRLGAVVAHAAELTAGASGPDTLDRAVADLDGAVDSLAATRAALAELEAL